MLIYENATVKPKLEYKAVLLSMEELSNETTRGICQTSECYGKRYSCPPFAPSISYFKKNYTNVLALLISTERKGIENWYFLSDLLHNYGRRIEGCLEGISFTAGKCRLCEICEVELDKPCSKPEEMRYSFTGVGLDAGKLSKILHYELWDEAHTSAVAGCLTNKETADHEMLFQMFCEVASEITRDKDHPSENKK